MAFLRPLISPAAPVFWAFAALILLASLAIIVSNRGAVRVAACIVIAATLGWGLYRRMDGDPQAKDPLQRGRPASPAAVLTSMPLDTVVVKDLKLTGGGAPFDLRGHVINTAPATRLRSITLLIKRKDCYEGALDPSGCVVVWQDQRWVQLSVAAETDRDFELSFYARISTPQIRGVIRDEFQLLAATGEPMREERAPEKPAPGQ